VAPTILSQVDELMRGLGLEPCVKRSDFLEHIGARIVRARWLEARGTAPKASTPLSHADEGFLDVALRDLPSALAAANESCRGILAALEALAAGGATTWQWTQASERICTRVGALFCSGAVVDAAAEQALAADVIASLPTEQPISPDEFCLHYREAYERAWAAKGCASVTGHPPSAIALGVDRRPHLVDVVRVPVSNWSLGSNRAVYLRYRLHFKASSRSISSCCPRCADRASAPESDKALLEVARACEPYGLGSRTHQVVLRSLADGLAGQPDPHGGWLDWATWATPCRPIATDRESDEDLAEAVASALSAWQFHPVGAVLVRQFGLVELLVALRWVAVRRTWMDLHRHERTFAEPLRTCGIPLSVRNTLFRAFPNVYREWRDGLIGDPPPENLLDPCPTSSAAPGSAALEGFIGRRSRTLTKLTANPSMVKQVIDGSVELWRASYAGLVANAPDDHLTAEEAFDLVEALIEGMD
jgi:hypothetical protein